MDLDLCAEQSYNFFFVCPNADNPYWDMVKEGIADADKYYGVHTETIGSNSLEEEIRVFKTGSSRQRRTTVRRRTRLPEYRSLEKMNGI